MRIEDAVLENGFEDVSEFSHLVSTVDLTKPGADEAFRKWQHEDGSKEGLLKLPSREPRTTKVTVWTLTYHPFVMGGKTWQETKAEVEAYGPYDLGQGYFGYVFSSKEGKWHVAESTTGALVGAGITIAAALKDVRNDIGHGDPEVMKGQVEKAKRDLESARSMETEEFLRILAKADK